MKYLQDLSFVPIKFNKNKYTTILVILKFNTVLNFVLFAQEILHNIPEKGLSNVILEHP